MTTDEYYENFLLKKIEQCIEDLPNYQTTFLKYRSADVHTLRRKESLKENRGYKIVVASIDLKQALIQYDTEDKNGNGVQNDKNIATLLTEK